MIPDACQNVYNVKMAQIVAQNVPKGQTVVIGPALNFKTKFNAKLVLKDIN